MVKLAARRVATVLKKLPRPKTRVGAVAVALVVWACLPLVPGAFEGTLFAMWPRKKKLKKAEHQEAA